MTTIYIESVEHDDVGEVEGAFDESGKLLHIWASNDAYWRHEYFNPLLKSLGITVKRGEFEEKLVLEAKRLWGY